LAHKENVRLIEKSTQFEKDTIYFSACSLKIQKNWCPEILYQSNLVRDESIMIQFSFRV